MMTVWAVLLGVLALAAPPVRAIITDMCQKEARTRLAQAPVALLRLAARQVPREWRADFLGEWLAELDDIRRATSETPVTGLVRQLLFALSLVIHARAVAREFTGERRPWIPRSLPRWASLRRALRSARQRVTRSLRPVLAPAGSRVSGGGTVSLRWPVAVVAVAALASASTFFIMSLTRQGAGPRSPGTPAAAAALELDPHYLSINLPVASPALLASPSTARMLAADVESEVERLAPGRSAGFVMVFAPGSLGSIAQSVAAASQFAGTLRTQDLREFKDAVGEGFWTGDSQAVSVRVFLFDRSKA